MGFLTRSSTTAATTGNGVSRKALLPGQEGEAERSRILQEQLLAVTLQAAQSIDRCAALENRLAFYEDPNGSYNTSEKQTRNYDQNGRGNSESITPSSSISSINSLFSEPERVKAQTEEIQMLRSRLEQKEEQINQLTNELIESTKTIDKLQLNERLLRRRLETIETGLNASEKAKYVMNHVQPFNYF